VVSRCREGVEPSGYQRRFQVIYDSCMIILLLQTFPDAHWLFAGSVDAGRRAANFLTLVSSAVRNDLDVWSYIKDVLDHLLAGETDYATLRPDAWAAAHPDKIRAYRTTERRERAERKKIRRATRRRRDHR